MWHRLRNDFPLAILTFLGACATLGILPFAIYRFATGNLLAGALDTAMMLSIIGSAAYGWRTGDTRTAAWFDVVLTMSGCVAVAILYEWYGLMWMYVGVLSTFLLLRHVAAVAVTAIALALVAIEGSAFTSALQMGTFLVTVAVVALFAAIFAYRAECLREQIQMTAALDPLTGAANRRSMDDEVHMAIDMARRERRPCGLAILDLDHFKEVNDRHGHSIGDQVLVDFVKLVRSSTRKVDRLFRYGGEEFVLLLPGADRAAMTGILENLRRHISENLRARGEPVTASIGGATLRPGDDADAWLRRADATLYEAKHAGRNRCVVADEQPHAAVRREPERDDEATTADR